MHELSIAQSILNTVLDERAARGLDQIDSITVQVGALSGVLPDALDFCFEAIRMDTPLAGCTLEIETVPIRISCGECGTETTVDNFLFVCPVCDSVRVEVITGYELELTCIEVPDPVPELTDP